MIEQMMMPGWMWGGKFKWELRDEYGNVERKGEGPNMLHRLGQNEVLTAFFAPESLYMEPLEVDALYDQADHADGAKCLHSASGTDDPFDDVTAGDYLYLIGGTNNEVTPGIYVVASVGADVENVLLSADPYAGDVASGIVVFRGYLLQLALDNRSALSTNDTAAGLASYEEDGGGYARVDLNPYASNWTIAYDSNEDAYTAESVVATFTASDATWQANRNMALVLQYGAAGEVLIGSMSLGGAVTVADTKSITVQYSVPIRGTKT
jgi:hypothetical protein